MKSSFDPRSTSKIYESSHSDDSTNTSCSVISANCIEYDSDIESDDSIHFYTQSTDFVDNEFLRINHKPFLQLWRKKQEQDKDNDKHVDNDKEKSISELINNEIFIKINELNKEIETEYLKLKNSLIIENKKEES